jgi:glycine cleavage system transcriptional repressor
MEAMTQHTILTATGPDRPGLVDEVSEFLFELGANIEDSRMVNLRGQFAMVVLFSGGEGVRAKTEANIAAFAQKLSMHVDLTPVKAREAAPVAAMPYRLTATAMDQAGLVHEISHLLRAANANIESMETKLSAAPITGAPMFEMELVMAVPTGTPIGKLREELDKLCNELNVDWQLALCKSDE